MLTKKRIDVPLKLKSVGDSGEFEGYASVFGIEDSYGDVVVKGAFEKTLTNWGSKGRLPSMLWQHDTSEPIGVYTEMKEDENGLFVKGKLLIEDDALAKRAHAHLKAGSISGMSIGYILNDYEYDKSKGVWILKEIDLFEVSLVTFPANDESRVQNVKSDIDSTGTPSPKELERVLRDVGLSRSQAKSFMSCGYKAFNQRDAEKDVLESLRNLKFL